MFGKINILIMRMTKISVNKYALNYSKRSKWQKIMLPNKPFGASQKVKSTKEVGGFGNLLQTQPWSDCADPRQRCSFTIPRVWRVDGSKSGTGFETLEAHPKSQPYPVYYKQSKSIHITIMTKVRTNQQIIQLHIKSRYNT